MIHAITFFPVPQLSSGQHVPEHHVGSGLTATGRFASNMLAVTLAVTFSCQLWAAAAPERQPLWPHEPPTGEQKASVDGQPNVPPPFVTVYQPSRPNGTVVVICPGGGYGGLALEPEGHGIARWLNRHSIIGVVLEYRLPHGNRFVPLLDAQRAIRWARSQAGSWSADPQRVGIIGFSAGGHLASTASTHFDGGQPDANDPVERLSCRPDFTILIYPVITMGDLTHGGSRQNLLGAHPTPDIIASYSNEKQVTALTPPAFLAHAIDDRIVSHENSLLYHHALRRHGIPSRYLELPWGDHGLRGYQGATWDAWQSGCLEWMIDQKLLPESERGAVRQNTPAIYPRYDAWAGGVHRERLLPGVGRFVFSFYGVPGEAAKVRELLDELRERKLANGFDPGPGASASQASLLDFMAANGWPLVLYSGAEMQIQGGRSIMGLEQQRALSAYDQLGVFYAYQLGEWGYYFHNLAPRESWWRDVYGDELDQYRHLMKPAGLAGYSQMPMSKRECYEQVKDYFLSRQRDLLDRVISVTGHSHYEAYAAEWGSRCIGLELGENIAYTQSKLAFARGASRQWDRPWSVQVSPWFGPSVTTHGPLRSEGGIWRGLDAGHSLSFYQRMWLHSWFAGAAMVTPENSQAIFFEQTDPPWTMTHHGHSAAQLFQFMQTHERGIPYTPIAVVLDHLAGYNGYMDKPWGILTPTDGDRQARDLFDHQLFPGADHHHRPRDEANPESSYLRPTPYGEIFDVLLTSVSSDTLSQYPVILLVGDIEFTPAFLGHLEQALRAGRRVAISSVHREALGTQFDRLASQGTLEVLEPWTNPATGRAAAISHRRLQSLADELLPIEVSGDAIQFALNRTRRGWVVELINNQGVVKRGDQPAVIDPAATARVKVRAKFPAASVRTWRSDQPVDPLHPIDVEVAPGEVEFIELVEGPGTSAP